MPSLALTAMDMVTQRKLIKKPVQTLFNALNQEQNDLAIILVNDHGHYAGDWRPSDVELAGQVVIPFKSCLRWFENNLHTNLITLFARKKLSLSHFPDLLTLFLILKLKIASRLGSSMKNKKSI